MEKTNEKFKWRKWDYFWVIGILCATIILLYSIRLSEDANITNIISLIASGISIALAIIAIWWGWINNIESNRIYEKINEKLDNVAIVANEISKSVDRINPYNANLKQFKKAKGKQTERKDINNNSENRDLIILNEIRKVKEMMWFFNKGNDDNPTDEISFLFNRELTEKEIEKFVDLFEVSDIPLDTADINEGNDGIDIHLDEAISEFEIYKAKEKMNELLKEINSDLKVVD